MLFYVGSYIISRKVFRLGTMLGNLGDKYYDENEDSLLAAIFYSLSTKCMLYHYETIKLLRYKWTIV